MVTRLLEHRKVGVVASNSIAYVEALFECYQNNHVVVLLRDKNDSRIEQFGIEEVIVPSDTHGWCEQNVTLPRHNGLAQISFTSGTEGEPKGVMLSHQALADVTKRLNDVMEVNASIREYVGVPANYSFGLGRFRAVLSAGGKAFLPQNGFNPVEIKSMLERGEINAISAVPSLWRVLLKHKDIFSNERKNIKWIEIGSQYMSRAEKEELKQLFPKAIIAQHYGLTEASRTTFLRIDQVEGETLESVGQALGETQIKLSDDNRIMIKGPHVAQLLFINGEEVNNLDEDDWFETSDTGEIKDDYLFYKGRADDLINCAGIKLSPEAIERDIRESLAIKEGVAVSRIPNNVTGDGVLVAKLAEADINLDKLKQAAINVISKLGVSNKNAVEVYEITSFPVTGTGKVQRKKLPELVIRKKTLEDNAKQQSYQQSLTPEQQEIASVWQSVLKMSTVDIDRTFYDQGGDSLLVISAMIEMEKRGIADTIAKGMIQGLTIREMASQFNRDKSSGHKLHSESLKTSMTINAVRGFLVLIVIASHWYHGVIERLFSSDAVVTIKSMFQPLFSMGTPGFAIIYGVGLGFSLLPVFLRDPKRARTIFLKTFFFIGVGIFALAGIRVIANFEGIFYQGSPVEYQFFSVLVYYLLASLTMYLWFKVISLFKSFSLGLLLLAISCYLFHLHVVAPLSGLELTGVSRLLQFMFTGKYAYFLMLSGTFVGISLGFEIERMVKQSKPISDILLIGFTCVLTGVAITYHVGSYIPWTELATTNLIWRWFVYFGVVIVLLVYTHNYLKNYNKLSKLNKLPVQFLATFGVLAFPLFVLHEMIIPLKAIVVSMINNDLLAIVISFGIFCSILFWLFRKVYKISYS